ncbi:MAG: hypothetical protein LBJ21_04095 [Acidobacteriota bacterium]|jgi:hypothetical protein|nr:hypothetical protein [Acidobacteriota bacterium]
MLRKTQSFIAFLAACGFAVFGPCLSALKAQDAAGVQFKPYGWVQVDAAYDSARTSYGDLMFMIHPETAVGAGRKELSVSARGTRFGINIIAPESNGRKVTGRIEGDFCDDLTPNKYALRLRLAYVDVALGNGWSARFGQDWDTYVNFHPNTVDASILAYMGHTYGRHPQARLTKETRLGEQTSLTAKIALQHGRNNSDLDGDGQPDENASAVPSVHGSMVFKTRLLTGQQSVFTISGVYGREKLGENAAHPGTYRSRFLHGGIQLPLSERFAISGEGWMGENVDNYLGGIGQGINVVEGTEISARGGWVQGVWSPVKAIKTGVGFGVDDPEDADLSGDARTLNGRIFANIFYYLTDRVTLGLEYTRVRTDYAITKDMQNNRVHFGVMYVF